MEKDAKEALQVSKEIVVKFIETGRVSPTNFSEIFSSVYQVVLETITRPHAPRHPFGTDTEAESGGHQSHGPGA